jgi:hypothetical protein
MEKNKKKSGSIMPVISFKRTLWYVSISAFLTFFTNVHAEIKTTNNLLVNPDFESGNANAWTLNGDVQVINDCCNSQYDVEFGDAGSIEQDVNLLSNQITQPMLDNGIQLDSSVLIQNGEGGIGGWANNRGDADEFTIRLQIKDADQNILGTHSQSRTTTTDIIGETFTDTLIYGGTGGSIANIKISGTDSNAPSTLGGSNVDDVSLRLTYDDTVLSVQQTETLQELEKEIFELVQVEEIFFEETISFEMPIEEFIIEEEIILEVENEFVEETIVLSTEVFEEVSLPENVPESTVEETIEIAEEIFSEEITNEEIVNEEVEEEIQETEIVSSTPRSDDGVSTEETTETQNNSGSIEVAISIEDISKKVSEKIKSAEGQLKATQIIIAKVMQKNNNTINQYSKVNTEIFNQPNLVDRNIDTYMNSNYVDIRNIYQDRIYEDRNGY